MMMMMNKLLPADETRLDAERCLRVVYQGSGTVGSKIVEIFCLLENLWAHYFTEPNLVHVNLPLQVAMSIHDVLKLFTTQCILLVCMSCLQDFTFLITSSATWMMLILYFKIQLLTSSCVDCVWSGHRNGPAWTLHGRCRRSEHRRVFTVVLNLLCCTAPYQIFGDILCVKDS